MGVQADGSPAPSRPTPGFGPGLVMHLSLTTLSLASSKLVRTCRVLAHRADFCDAQRDLLRLDHLVLDHKLGLAALRDELNLLAELVRGLEQRLPLVLLLPAKVDEFVEDEQRAGNDALWKLAEGVGDGRVLVGIQVRDGELFAYTPGNGAAPPLAGEPERAARDDRAGPPRLSSPPGAPGGGAARRRGSAAGAGRLVREPAAAGAGSPGLERRLAQAAGPGSLRAERLGERVQVLGGQPSALPALAAAPGNWCWAAREASSPGRALAAGSSAGGWGSRAQFRSSRA